MNCETMIHDKVCVGAEVTISPGVEIGETTWCCVGKPKIEACPSACSYVVSQMMCVRFALRFTADVSAAPNGIICNAPVIE